MTNINCTNDCVYQKDGKCALDSVNAANLTFHTECIYYTPKQESKKGE